MNISGRGKKSRKYVYYEHCENAILQKVQSKCSQNRLLSENQCIFSRICMLIYASATEMESVVCDKNSKTTRKPRKCSIFGAFLACLTRFERAAFRVGADQTGYSKMQINKGIRRFLGFFPSIVFVTYIPKPSSIVHSSHRCVVEMW